MEVLTDEVGRSSITRDNARLLIAEHREAEARQREVAERQERQAIEADRLRRAQRWPGVPAAMIPDGLSAASDMLAAAHDSRPRRQSPLQHALANEGSLVYHPIRGDEGES